MQFRIDIRPHPNVNYEEAGVWDLPAELTTDPSGRTVAHLGDTFIIEMPISWLPVSVRLTRIH